MSIVSGLILRTMLALAISFVLWVVGWRFFQPIIYAALAVEASVRGLLSSLSTGLLLGVLNGLISWRLARELVILLVGSAAGWVVALIILPPPATDIAGIILPLAPYLAITAGVGVAYGLKPTILYLVAARAPRPQTQMESAAMQQPSTSTAPPPSGGTVMEAPQPTAQPSQAPATSPQAAGAESTGETAESGPAETAAPEEEVPGPPLMETGALREEEGVDITARATPAPSLDELEEMLLDIIVDEGLSEIVPLPNNTSPEGGSFPSIESRLGVETGIIMRLLRRLQDKNVVRVAGVEFKKIVCPHCQSALHTMNLRCKACGSVNIGRQRVMQHEACGYLGPETSFVAGERTICPRCGSQVRITASPLEEGGAEVLKVHSTFFTCFDCNEVSLDPNITFRCLICGIDYDMSSFEFRTFYRYTVNPEVISALQERSKPMRTIAEELRRRGFEARVNARVVGASKVTHRIDLLFGREGKLDRAVFILQDLGEGLSVNSIIRIIFVKSDLRLERVALLSMRKLSEDARFLASQYGILLIEDMASKDIYREVITRLAEL
jgi:ribosomal protein S27AE